MPARRMVLTCPVRTVKADVIVARAETMYDAQAPGRTRQTAWGRGAPGQTRRSLIRRAVAVLALAASPAAAGGCGLLDRDPEPAPEPDPIEPLITGALDLAIRYEAAIAAFPALADRLGPVAEAHRAHAEELSRVIGSPLPTAGTGAVPGATSATSQSGGGDQAATISALRAAEREGRQAAVQVCLGVPAERAALVASVAAARAAHLEVLR